MGQVVEISDNLPIARCQDCGSEAWHIELESYAAFKFMNIKGFSCSNCGLFIDLKCYLYEDLDGQAKD